MEAVVWQERLTIILGLSAIRIGAVSEFTTMTIERASAFGSIKTLLLPIATIPCFYQDAVDMLFYLN